MTKEQKGALVIGLIGFSLLPIWGCAGGWRGMNFLQYTNTALFRGLDAIPHVPIEEAIINARKAYCEVEGLDYEASYDTIPISTRTDTRVSGWIG